LLVDSAVSQGLEVEEAERLVTLTLRQHLSIDPSPPKMSNQVN
jgi:hypothetical protein